ncbi:hypothetical protein FACS1894203_4360 [Bacteroidia bacterium]|nr:hypothetical protein FACS1894203_4360 [Bacteroidia bacterium]
MKNLDLNAYGVVEMSQQEMVDTEGGLFLAGLIVCAVIALCATSCVNSPVTIQVGSKNSSQQSTEADSTSVANGSGNGNSATVK